MKNLVPSLFVLLTLGGAKAADHPGASYPAWAYAVPTPDNEAVAPTDDGTAFTLPGSDGHFTRSQISGAGHKPPADWYPGDHPSMPALVAAGDAARGITACAGCHYPNGKGRPQNANIAGLDRDYLVRQLHDMQRDLRKSAEPKKHNAQQMVDFAKAMTDGEITQAASYYASLPPTVPIKVVETATVPKMRSQEGLWLPPESGAREPIGNRVIETPADVDREQLRDPHAGFIAYAPRARWRKAGAWPRPWIVQAATAKACAARWRQALRAVRQAIWGGNCTTSSKARGTGKWRRPCSLLRPSCPAPIL